MTRIVTLMFFLALLVSACARSVPADSTTSSAAVVESASAGSDAQTVTVYKSPT